IAGLAIQLQRLAFLFQVLAADEAGDVDQMPGNQEVEQQQDEPGHQIRYVSRY
ncbi:MAG: hypothetical protein GY792_14085, partial [Gammaproteobacteria bacterium]|nr:hypothetical protein [Gammaproteobacteria bacterium]